MTTRLLLMLVEEIEVGDVVEFFTNDPCLVEDVRENSDMNGCWFECTNGQSVFYKYGDKVNLVVDA